MADNDAAVADAEVPAKPAKDGKGKRAKKKSTKKAAGTGRARGGAGRVKFPKHSILGCIRIPQAILEQNVGEACTDKEGAAFAKVGWNGDVGVEIGSAIK